MTIQRNIILQKKIENNNRIGEWTNTKWKVASPDKYETVGLQTTQQNIYKGKQLWPSITTCWLVIEWHLWKEKGKSILAHCCSEDRVSNSVIEKQVPVVMALAKHSPSVDQPDESSYFHIICIVEVRNVVVGEHRGIETCSESLDFFVRMFNHHVQHVICEHAFPGIYRGCQISCTSVDPWCTSQDVSHVLASSMAAGFVLPS